MKRIFIGLLLFTVLLTPLRVGAADTEMSTLGDASGLAKTHIVWVVISGALYKTTIDDVLSLIEAGHIPDLSSTYLTPAAAAAAYLASAGIDNVKDTHIDWGTGAGQVSADDIGDGSTNAIPTLTQESNWDVAYGLVGAVPLDSDFTNNGYMRRTAAGTYQSCLDTFDASTAPTADEDTGDGYCVGSIYVDTTNDKAYVCLDNSSGAAVWTETTAGAVATVSQVDAEAGTSTTVYNWTPLRVAQAIAALASTSDTIGWAYTALSSAPGSPVTGKVYVANNDDWDPGSIDGTDDYFVIYTGSAYVPFMMVDGTWLLDSFSGTTPQIIFKDDDATAGDDNVYWTVNCTDTGDGTEDCDITLYVQVAGTATALLTVDADGHISIGDGSHNLQENGTRVSTRTATTTETLTNKTIDADDNTISDWPCGFCVAASDETTDLTTGTAKVTFRMPYAMTVTDVRASVNTAPVGSTLTVDINESGTTILSTILSIDASEETSESAETAAVISDSALADDAEITVDIDQIGSSTAGKGLKVCILGTRDF